MLKFGDRGPTVAALQQRLLALGFSVGKSGADGIFGVDTRAAVAAFQRANGIYPADGTVGAATSAALDAVEFIGPPAASGGGPLATAPGPLSSFFGEFDWRLGVALGGLVVFALIVFSERRR